MTMFFRRFRPLPLLAAAVLSFAACNGDDSPLAPQDAAPASGPVPDPGQVEAATPAEAALLTTDRIAFISLRLGGYWSAYKMDPAGNNVVRLTKNADDVFQPAWSYDNKRLAVVRSRFDGNGASADDIWLVNADGTNGHWLRKTMSPWYLADPSWAPDGSHLLVSLYWVNTWYLAKIEVATGNITLLHPSGGGIMGRQPSYDKAGKRIAYVGASKVTLDQVYADGSGHKTLYKADKGQVDVPRFSPDGGRIVFQKGPFGGNTDVFVKNLGTGVVTRLTSSLAADGHATWSPDGTRLAFTSSRTGPDQVYTMTAAGGSQTRITHSSVGEGWPVWTH
jgi:Tol biopolymer transport system component